MKFLAAIPLVVVAFAACSSQKSAEYPEEGVEPTEPSSLDDSSPNGLDDSDRNARAAEPQTPAQTTIAPAPASDEAMVPASGEPQRRQPAERLVEPPNTPDRPVSTWNADKPTAGADNTGINERDRTGSTKTPLDQGNGEVDLGITQTIRKAVVAEKSLSFSAKNVKIITLGGHVTLRGPVKTADERAKIVAFAKQAAGVLSVDDQIEIAP
jgi:hypothetical protein